MLVAGPVTVELGRTMEKQETEPGEGEWLAPWAGLGLTPNEIRAYEFALRDHLNLVVAQGSREEIERARIALGTVGAERLARHALAFPAPGTYATQLLR